MTGRAQPNVFTIPAGVPFARALARGVVDKVGRDPLAMADVVLLVPTRRAARVLHEEFALVLGGATLGPRIRTLGDLDEDEIGFGAVADDLDLAPAIAPLRRRLLLAGLVERWAEARGAALPFAQAAAHAGELARFLDEVTAQGVDLAKLEGLVPALYAEHWQNVVAFLAIIAKQWPAFLAESGMVEPVARRDGILRRYAAGLAASPPATPVFAAGSTGSIPATAELLKVIAHLPSGAVVLPALDTGLDAESWAELDPGHAQYGLRQLLQEIGLPREEVALWPAAQSETSRAERVRFLSEALRPPPTTDRWRALVDAQDFAAGTLDGLALIEAANAREEALVIAIALREALETPERTAALVTPDRGLARRVAGELARWDIAIDDSAGTKLSRTPPGAFLSLLAQAAAEDFSPIPLLALLKHPLAGAGDPANFRRQVRALELKILHGQRPAPGLAGIAAALQRKERTESLQNWFARIAGRLQPFARAMEADSGTLADIAGAHAAAAEALAGAKDLWRGESGDGASLLMQELLEHGSDISIDPARNYAQLFRDLAEGRVVRPRYGRHPRLAILGPLEARLQSFDLTILGGVNEGTWPGEAGTDPWLSRPLRGEIGLEAPERRIGLAAHDFATLAAGPDVLLTRALKQEGAPTNASRWLLRIKQLAKGLSFDGSLRRRDDLLHWARQIDAAPLVPRVPRPEPRPPVAVRPRTLRVTEIETWLRDPYALYAKYILRLKVLDRIDIEPGPRERGIAVHKALEHFLVAFPDTLPDDAFAQLCRCGDEAFADVGASPAVLALWRPRFSRAARWFLAYEQKRRSAIARPLVEQSASFTFAGPAGAFTVRGRADRIDLMPDGTAQIVDYKTGRAPTQKQIDLLLSPQLPLEAAMLMHGAFPDIGAAQTSALLHIRLTGGVPPGEECPYNGDADAKGREALQRLMGHVARYDDVAQPYRSREFIERLTDVGDYDHLARVREWLLIDRGEE